MQNLSQENAPCNRTQKKYYPYLCLLYFIFEQSKKRSDGDQNYYSKHRRGLEDHQGAYNTRKDSTEEDSSNQKTV